MRPRFRTSLVVLAALLSVTACGTTVPLTQQQSSGLAPGLGTVAGDGLTPGSVPGGTSGTGGTTGTSLGGSTGSSVAGGTSGGTGVVGGTSGSTGGTTGGSTSGTGAGPAGAADRTPVRVGFEVIKGGNEAVSAAFGTPVNFGNGKLEVNAIVKDVNAHGGVNGRKIVPVFAEWDVTSKDAGREADCRALAEDGKVTFMITVINMSQSFANCAKKHGTPVVNASFGAGDLTIYQQYGDFLFSPGLMNLDRELRLILETARSGGSITASKKVGVIIDGVEDPQFARIYKRTVDPMLAQWGIPHESFTVAQQADVSAAVLRFNNDGVKTVVFVAPSGIIEVLFMQTADQQRYRPSYVLGDSTSPWFIGTAAPPNQIKGVTGAGSLPLSNVGTDQYPTTPREKRCLDLIKAEGESNAERHSSITATVYCEAIYAFTAVGSRVSGPLTAQAFRAAYPTIGTSYAPVTTFATNFANGRHDNASQYRLLGYKASCSCISYLTGLRPLPA